MENANVENPAPPPPAPPDWAAAKGPFDTITALSPENAMHKTP